MSLRRFFLSLGLLAASTCILFSLPQPQASSQLGVVTLATFTNAGPGDVIGSSPYALLLGQDGFLYGTLNSGVTGATAKGAIFKMGINGNIAWVLGMTNAEHPSQLLQGPDGNLYGVGSGTVFSASTSGELLWSVAPTNSGAVNWLTFGADGMLYGACPSGGTNGDGQIVSLDLTGAYRWVFSFNQTNGNTPSGPLTLGRDGNFYGVTTNGGKNNQGVVFSINTNGTLNWTNSFSGTHKSPFGQLVQGADGNLYGTVNALFSQFGSVFSISTTGTTNWFYTAGSLNVLNGTMAQGVDGNLYVGSTIDLFSLTTNGAFRWSAKASGSVWAARSDGDVLASGQSSFANLFAIYSVTSAGQVDATAYVTNAYQGTLVTDAQGNIFGAAGIYPFSDGNNSGGAVFELLAAPEFVNQPRDVMDLKNAAATFSVSAIGAPTLSYQWQKDGTNISEGGEFSGTQSNQLTISPASAFDAGSYDVVVSNFYGDAASAEAELTFTNSFSTAESNIIYSLPNPTFFNPDGFGLPYMLTAGTDGSLYGTTVSGFIFKATTAGKLVASTGDQTGGTTLTSLIEGVDGNLYGTDGGGILALTTNLNRMFGDLSGIGEMSGIAQGSNLTLYWTKEFPGTEGIYATTTSGVELWANTNVPEPADVILGRNGNLYACSQVGGTNNAGTIFSLATNGTLLWSVSTGGTNIIYPDGLTQGSDGFLYGTSFGNYSNNFGGVFKMATNGTLIWTFQFQLTNGASLYPKLTQATDGNLYGTTDAGGASGFGTIFRITTNGVMTSLYSFTGGGDGGFPLSGPVQGHDGALYGVTEIGGPEQDGVLYRLDLGLAAKVTPPVLETASVTNGVVSFIWSAAPNLSYQLQVAGALPSGWTNQGAVFGATNSIITISDTANQPQRFYRLLVVP